MSALRTTADAHVNLQPQFDSHKCEPEDSGLADVLLRQQPDEEQDEEEDERKEENDDDDDDDTTDDGYSE